MLHRTATPEQVSFVDGCICRDRSCRELYYAQASLHAELSVMLGEEPAGKGRSWIFRGIAALAAGMLAAAGAFELYWFAQPVAEVRTNFYGVWADGSPVAEKTPLYRNERRLREGLVEIVTSGGTSLLVEGPAVFRIASGNRMRLENGSVVVQMRKGANGFVVDTSSMKILDLGTEFGVRTGVDARDMVQVFDGKVLASSKDTLNRRELSAGEGVVVDGAGRLLEKSGLEGTFVRRIPSRKPGMAFGGEGFNRPSSDTVFVRPRAKPVAVDGALDDWLWSVPFKAGCLPPYEQYRVEGRLMYDEHNLYVAASVFDPEPMRNRAQETLEFTGGSVVVRFITDSALGYPISGCRIGPDDKVAFVPPEVDSAAQNLIFWYDAKTSRPRLRIKHDVSSVYGRRTLIDDSAWEGAFTRHPDGLGYTLEARIPFETIRPGLKAPKAGEVWPSHWNIHWSDAEGATAHAQLIEIVNRQETTRTTLRPILYFTYPTVWGKAVFLPECAGENQKEKEK